MSEVESAEARASEYHLSWNNYHASIASFLKILSSAKEGEEDLSDVTISCAGNKQFSAHRLVLATCSSYFRQLFVGKVSKDKFVVVWTKTAVHHPRVLELHLLR